MAATCSSSSWISAKVKPWASKRTIACSRVNFCGSGSGMRGGETFRTIGMLHLLRGLYRTPVIVQQRLLFGKIRPYFHKVGFAMIHGITSSDTVVIRPSDETLFLYCLFLLSSDQFVALASKTVKEGSKMPRADWGFLHK